jgi:hypothetical protein
MGWLGALNAEPDDHREEDGFEAHTSYSEALANTMGRHGLAGALGEAALAIPTLALDEVNEMPIVGPIANGESDVAAHESYRQQMQHVVEEKDGPKAGAPATATAPLPDHMHTY